MGVRRRPNSRGCNNAIPNTQQILPWGVPQAMHPQRVHCSAGVPPCAQGAGGTGMRGGCQSPSGGWSQGEGWAHNTVVGESRGGESRCCCSSGPPPKGIGPTPTPRRFGCGPTCLSARVQRRSSAHTFGPNMGHAMRSPVTNMPKVASWMLPWSVALGGRGGPRCIDVLERGVLQLLPVVHIALSCRGCEHPRRMRIPNHDQDAVKNAERHSNDEEQHAVQGHDARPVAQHHEEPQPRKVAVGVRLHTPADVVIFQCDDHLCDPGNGNGKIQQVEEGLRQVGEIEAHGDDQDHENKGAQSLQSKIGQIRGLCESLQDLVSQKEKGSEEGNGTELPSVVIRRVLLLPQHYVWCQDQPSPVRHGAQDHLLKQLAKRVGVAQMVALGQQRGIGPKLIALDGLHPVSLCDLDDTHADVELQEGLEEAIVPFVLAVLPDELHLLVQHIGGPGPVLVLQSVRPQRRPDNLHEGAVGQDVVVRAITGREPVLPDPDPVPVAALLLPAALHPPLPFCHELEPFINIRNVLIDSEDLLLFFGS
mmetsp:Transcript_30002/g.48201  ORF Transcript_30002/g.48201 Transcript_30002/m.48201 type:complete len:534 (-) Transcript_30002:253-1854(-)